MERPDQQLLSYVEALRPLIYIPHFDLDEVEALLQKVTGGSRVLAYSNAGAWSEQKQARRVLDTPRSLAEFLAWVNDETHGEFFIVLYDVHEQLGDPQVMAYLKRLAHRTMQEEGFRATCFIVSGRLQVPLDLEPYMTVFELPLPTEDDIRDLVDEYARSQGIAVEPGVKATLCLSFKGFTRFAVRQILDLAFQRDGRIDADDMALISQEKQQVIRRTGILEIIETVDGMVGVGGLANLKEWLDRKARIFRDIPGARAAGVDMPRGILIVGMPGCGKTLAAKAAAPLLGVPLLRLDVGKVLGKYVGESEENLRRALRTVEAASPCVLWVDELEKAFAGVGQGTAGHEVTTRLFGYFLTWLQEQGRHSTVFVVATANDISRLPAEFLRRGRFDELFLVDFPTAAERAEIFRIHLQKRRHWHEGYDLAELAKRTQDFTGADIEGVVKEAVEAAYLAGHKSVTTRSLLDVIAQTQSFRSTMQEKVDQLRQSLAQYHFKPASR